MLLEFLGIKYSLNRRKNVTTNIKLVKEESSPGKMDIKNRQEDKWNDRDTYINFGEIYSDPYHHI